MGRKVLFVASTHNHILSFHMPYLRLLKSKGFEVHTASGGEIVSDFIDIHHSIPFSRSPYSLSLFSNYVQLRKLIKKERYDIVHCHTPSTSFITRLAANNSRKKGTLVIYTAHGFHFYKNAPKSSIIYRVIEQTLASYTDCIITINDEDYRVAKTFPFRNVAQMKSMGVNPEQFFKASRIERNKLRHEYGIPEDAFVIIYPAEFIKRKNHCMLVAAAVELKKRIPELYLLLPGGGPLKAETESLLNSAGLGNRTWMPGYRNDVNLLMQMADVDAAPSIQEGKSVHTIEALCCGVPVVCTNIRGHSDEIVDGQNGFLVEVNNPTQMADRIYHLYSDRELYDAMSNDALKSSYAYHIDHAVKEFEEIYRGLGIVMTGGLNES